jgi:RNA polymerase sigma-70 factor (sigma-E family)
VTTSGEGLAHRAVAEFEEERGQALYAYAYVLTGNRDDAQDLVQDTIVALLRRSDVGDVQSLMAYARKSIYHAWVTRHRRSSVLRRITPRLAAPAPDESGESGVDLRDSLWRSLAELPTRQRAALVLRYYEDLDDHQIGAVLGCSPTTVRSHVARGLARLRADHEPSTHTQDVPHA